MNVILRTIFCFLQVKQLKPTYFLRYEEQQQYYATQNFLKLNKIKSPAVVQPIQVCTYVVLSEST